MYDEVQDEITKWELDLEKELKKLEKQVGSAGSMFQLAFPNSPFPQIQPHLLAQSHREQSTGLHLKGVQAMTVTDFV